MFSLALASLRRRRAAFTASLLATFLGAVMVMTFASLIDTAVRPGVDSATRESLVTMASVVGGWSLLLVVFSIVSTTSLALRQRAAELALLRSAGATPGQVVRMVVAETLIVALVGSVLAVPVGWALGHLLFGLLESTDQVSDGTVFAFGAIALGQGFAVTLVSALAASVFTAVRATRKRVAASLLEAKAPAPTRIGRVRWAAIVFFLGAGIGQAVVTATVMHGKGSDAMQTAGSADIWFAIGLALFAPVLIRRVPAALPPVVLFVAISIGTLAMQDIDNRATGAAQTLSQRNIETLNLVVIGMIALFACIMLINTLTAATADRAREFGQYRLLGATPSQLLAQTAREALRLTVVGGALGLAASAVTILPFSYARTDDWLPSFNPLVVPAVLAVAALVTFVTLLVATRRALALPPVEAVAV